jgi:SAM-dependent methyltransferase
VGPGPGRFSRWLAARYPSLHLFDLSRPMLRACRRHLQRTAPSCRGTYIEGSLEAIPFRPRSFDRIVALGVLPFVADEFPRVLRDLGHLLARRGRLVFELPTPSQTTMTVLPPNPTGARTILHRPKEYHLWEVVREGYQPHDPAHWARFEFVWRRPEPLQDELTRAGLRIVDRMAIGPNFANQPAFLKVLRHDRSAYRTALELEEEIGRWPEVLGAGAGLLVAATPVPRATDPTGRTGRAHGPRRARA